MPKGVELRSLMGVTTRGHTKLWQLNAPIGGSNRTTNLCKHMVQTPQRWAPGTTNLCSHCTSRRVRPPKQDSYSFLGSILEEYTAFTRGVSCIHAGSRSQPFFRAAKRRAVAVTRLKFGTYCLSCCESCSFFSALRCAACCFPLSIAAELLSACLSSASFPTLSLYACASGRADVSAHLYGCQSECVGPAQCVMDTSRFSNVTEHVETCILLECNSSFRGSHHVEYSTCNRIVAACTPNHRSKTTAQGRVLTQPFALKRLAG